MALRPDIPGHTDGHFDFILVLGPVGGTIFATAISTNGFHGKVNDQ